MRVKERTSRGSRLGVCVAQGALGCLDCNSEEASLKEEEGREGREGREGDGGIYKNLPVALVVVLFAVRFFRSKPGLVVQIPLAPHPFLYFFFFYFGCFSPCTHSLERGSLVILFAFTAAFLLRSARLDAFVTPPHCRLDPLDPSRYHRHPHSPHPLSTPTTTCLRPSFFFISFRSSFSLLPLATNRFAFSYLEPSTDLTFCSDSTSLSTPAARFILFAHHRPHSGHNTFGFNRPYPSRLALITEDWFCSPDLTPLHCLRPSTLNVHIHVHRHALLSSDPTLSSTPLICGSLFLLLEACSVSYTIVLVIDSHFR